MANIKEIKVGNTIYNVKDKDAITKIKIGNNTYYEPTDGLVSLPEGIGGSYNTDAEARAAIILLNSRLADLAFNDQGRPTIDFNVSYFNVNVRTEGLVNCSAIIPPDLSIPAGSDLIIRIIANTGYALPNITTDNLETEQGTLEINWNQSGYESDSHTIYKIVFSAVTKEINLSIKNITAEVSVNSKIAVSCSSNNFGSWTSDPDIKSGRVEFDKNEQVAIIFTPANNYEFKTSSVNVYVHGQDDLNVTKEISKNTLKVVVKNPENTIFFEVNPLYKHYITLQTLTNCTLSPSLPEYILHGEEKTVEVVANSTPDATYTMDGGTVSVLPSNYANYDSNSHLLTIHPTETEETIKIMASAKLVQEAEQPATLITKVMLKLLNVTPDENSGFTNTVTEDNPFGYYVKDVDPSNPLSVSLNTISGATNNNDLKVIGVSTENEIVPFSMRNADYDINGNTLTIESALLESCKEIIISNTAHTDTITINCEQGLETYDTMFIQWKDNSITEVALHGGVNTVDCTGKDVITKLYTKFNNNTIINHLRSLGGFLLSADFGGHLIKGTDGQLFNSCSKLTSVKGLVIKEGTTTLASWFVGCTNLHEVDTIGWDLSTVTEMLAAFSGCTKGSLSLDLDFMDVGNVTKVFVLDSTYGPLSGLFRLSTFNILSLRYWNINSNNDTPMDISGMFTAVKLLGTDRKLDLSTFKVHNLRSLNKTFANTSSSTGKLSIDIRGLETPSLDDPNHGVLLLNMSEAFSGTNLDCLYVGNLNADYTDLDISNIRRSNDKIAKIWFTYPEPLKYNQDKDWINALIYDDSDYHTTLIFGEDEHGVNWYSRQVKTTFVINGSQS